MTVTSWTFHEAFVGDVNILFCRLFRSLLHIAYLLDMDNFTMKNLLVIVFLLVISQVSLAQNTDDFPYMHHIYFGVTFALLITCIALLTFLVCRPTCCKVGDGSSTRQSAKKISPEAFARNESDFDNGDVEGSVDDLAPSAGGNDISNAHGSLVGASGSSVGVSGLVLNVVYGQQVHDEYSMADISAHNVPHGEAKNEDVYGCPPDATYAFPDSNNDSCAFPDSHNDFYSVVQKR